MAGAFDPAASAALRDAVEVMIHTSAAAARAIVVWVVVLGDAVFARSFRGSSAK